MTLTIEIDLPTDLAVPGLTRARAKSVPAPIQVPTGGRGTITLGRALVGGHAVALPVPDFRYHTHIEGSTGSGKSVNLECSAVGSWSSALCNSAAPAPGNPRWVSCKADRIC